MNIAVVIYSLKEKGGTERVACNLANAFSEELGHNVILLNRDTVKNQVAFELTDGIQVEALSGNYLQFFKQLQDYIDQKHPDVLLIHNMGRLSLLCSLLRKGKTKIISLEHTVFEKRPFWQKELSKLVYKKVDQVVTVNARDCLDYSRWFSNVKNIANSSPFAISNNYQKDNKTIIAIGRLSQEKNFKALLEAWKLLQNELGEWSLEIYGVGEEEKQLNHYIKVNHLKQVLLMGLAEDVSMVYQKAAFLVMSSHYEGLPMVLIEAQSFGLPTIAFDCPHGPAEIIQHQQTGFLVKNQHVPALAESIVTLMRDETLREQFSQQSIKSAERFQARAIIQEWKNLLESENRSCET